MISLDRASYQVQPRYAEYAGLSTDAKPVEVDNGDEFQEINTGFVYKFDETNSEWVKQPTGGGGGAIDDDTISTGTTWSSRMIVDSLAPSFEISGPVVTCNPVAGYPLHVVSQIVPVQEGEGDPSPENVRPITGWDKATLMHNDTPISFSFGQTVYGGTLDWTTGVLTVNAAYLQLTSASNIKELSYAESKGVYFTDILNISENRANGISSHAVIDAVGTIPDVYPGGYMWIGVTNNFIYWVGILDVLGMQTIDDFKLWLDTQNVQVVYEIQEPLIIQLTPQEILALSGVNTIYTDTGDTTVSGRADPTTIINQLAARIAALESAATNI